MADCDCIPRAKPAIEKLDASCCLASASRSLSRSTSFCAWVCVGVCGCVCVPTMRWPAVDQKQTAEGYTAAQDR